MTERSDRADAFVERTREAVERLPRMAVVTRTGAQAHLARVGVRRGCKNLTYCGREWIDLHTSNVAETAATCSACVLKRTRETRKRDLV